MSPIILWLKTNLSAILVVLLVLFAITTCHERDKMIAENALYQLRSDSMKAQIKRDESATSNALVQRDMATKIAVALDKELDSVKNHALHSVRTVVLTDTTFVHDSAGKDSVAHVDSTVTQVVPLSELQATIAECDGDIAGWKRVVLSDSNTIRSLQQEVKDHKNDEKLKDDRIEELQKNRKWLVAKGMFVGVAILKGAEVLLQAVKK